MLIIHKEDMSQRHSKADNILGSIYLGDYIGAYFFKGRQLNVHHDCTLTSDMQIPLLLQRPNSSTDRSGAKVNHSNLALISEIIEKHYNSDLPLCVHCKGGVERSPLAIVYWLNTRRGYDWEDAYEYVKSRRSVVEERTEWM